MRFRPLMPLAAIAIVLGLASRSAKADLLDPLAFKSLGPLPTGDIIIVTSGGQATLEYGPGLGSTITGVVSNGVAVFTFDSINVAAGVNIGLNSNTDGGLPVALLSHSSIQLDGNVNVYSAYPAIEGVGNLTSGPGVGSAPSTDSMVRAAADSAAREGPGEDSSREAAAAARPMAISRSSSRAGRTGPDSSLPSAAAGSSLGP